ncbi:MAG: ABC transporter permease [Anaerolineae bacterium]|nr:ABC transporter permease [Anaerolineae bacterium]
MNRRHVIAMTRKEWLHITRDPMTIFLLVVGPVLMLLLVSYAMATDVENVPTVIYDMDQSPASQRLIARLDDSRVLDVTGTVDSIDAYEEQLERRETKLVVIIEDGFGAQVSTLEAQQNLGTNKPKFRFIIDGTDPISAETALEAAVITGEQFVLDELNALLDAQEEMGAEADMVEAYRQQLEAPIQTNVENRYNPDLKAIWDLVPAMIAVALMLPGMSISTVIARERSEGTLEALVATPISKHAILLGKSLPYVATSLINVILMYFVARIVFGVPFRGNLPLYLALTSLYVFATLAIGLLFSILIRSMEAALWASMLFFLFPGMLLSGMFFPVEVFPFLIKIETLELPVVSGVLINRGMFLQGVSVKVLWWNIALLLIIAVEGFEIAGRLFKKRIA